MDSPAVKALSHQCSSDSIHGLGVIGGLSLLLVLVVAPIGFSPGIPVFLFPQKPTFPNSNSILLTVKHFIMSLWQLRKPELPMLWKLNKLLYFTILYFTFY